MDEKRLKLGQIITDEQQRDAVHIAVAPVIAAVRLTPGTHVHIVDRRARRSVKGDVPVGIVDPYLRESVSPGQRFCLFLCPGSITSLRHEWSHPAFQVEAAIQPADAKAVSEKWLRDLCERHRSGDWDYDHEEDGRPCISYHALIAAMSEGDEEDYDGYTQSGSESLRDEMSDPETRALFWHHLEVVTGRNFSQKHRENHYFSCSC
jgi:hypothetical protein